MQFPFEPKAVHHKHGGKIVRITGIGHGIEKPRDGMSRDYWHFYGDVQWSDTSAVRAGLEIAPWALCQDSDEGRAEINLLMAEMNEYLRKHGVWCHGKSKHEGWYANDRKISRRA